ncbi:MAG: V-type ATP synthase subunit D [Clostridia bacterium]
MLQLSVKPTRMELSNLKKRLKVAVRGHKLMKDKRDEMVRRFIVYVKQNKELRESVEAGMSVAMQKFLLARSTMTIEEIEEALYYPVRKASIRAGVKNILSVKVPALEVVISGETSELPYGFLTTSCELDEAVSAFSALLPLLIRLAEVEKTCNLLADEIEKTRRRVNALEFVMIPQFQEAIRTIKMKLDENERGNLTRLMKTKEMLAKK